MENFMFFNPTRIVFGADQEKKVGELVKQYSDNILLVYGKQSIKANGIYNAVITSLKNSDIKYYDLCGVEGNPKLTKVYEGIQICKDNNLKFVLGVGGGSVIDTAKAIAAGTEYDGDIWDCYVGKGKPTCALPIGTILTVVGAGSEMSNSNVITNEKEKLKRSFDNEIIIPKFSILNPELTYTVSSYQTACGSFDAISHLLERYFTLTKSTDTTDRMIEGLLKTLILYTPLSIENPRNYAYRSELMWAACLAQNGLMNTGRIGDWGCHAIEHELSGEFDIAHGEGLSMITTTWMKYVYRINPDRFLQFAMRIFDVDYSPEYKEEAIQEGIVRLQCFIKRIGLKTDLTSLPIDQEMARKLADRAVLEKKTRGRFLKMTSDDIYNVIIQASENS